MGRRHPGPSLMRPQKGGPTDGVDFCRLTPARASRGLLFVSQPPILNPPEDVATTSLGERLQVGGVQNPASRNQPLCHALSQAVTQTA